MSNIKIKRIYDKADPSDGFRILVDMLWPRGMSKEKANINLWAKNLAPSTDLRKRYHSDDMDWNMFRQHYFSELDSKPEALSEIKTYLGKKIVTFLYSSKETRFNNAVALREYIESNP